MSPTAPFAPADEAPRDALRAEPAPRNVPHYPTTAPDPAGREHPQLPASDPAHTPGRAAPPQPAEGRHAAAVLPPWARHVVVWGASLFGGLNVLVSSVSIGLLAYNHLHLGLLRSAALALSLDSGAAVAATLWVAAPRGHHLRHWGCAVTLGLVLASMVGNAADFLASAAAVQPAPGALLTRDQLIVLAIALVVLAPVVAMLLGHLVLMVKSAAALARSWEEWDRAQVEHEEALARAEAEAAAQAAREAEERAAAQALEEAAYRAEQAAAAWAAPGNNDRAVYRAEARRPAQAQPSTDRPASPAGRPQARPYVDCLADLRKWIADNDGRIPSADAIRGICGVGRGRAEKLRDDVSPPKPAAPKRRRSGPSLRAVNSTA